MEKKSCPAILDCDECMWWREFRHEKKEAGQVEYFYRCGIEIIIDWMLKAENSLDGMQTAVNEARNRSVESKEATIALGQATLESFEMIGKEIKQQNTIAIED